MRWPPPAAGVGTGYAPGLMVRSSTRPASFAEARGAVKFGSTGIVAVVGMDVLARGVAMPGLDRRPAHRNAALIHYADAHANELAERAFRRGRRGRL